MIDNRRDMKTIIYKIAIVVMVAAFALPTMAQFDESQYSAQTPGTTFQSTSALSGSGSEYSSNPTIGDNGTAIAPSSSPRIRTIGQRRNEDEENPVIDDDEKDIGNPIGDDLLPLMLLAVGYAAARRRVKAC